MIDLDFDFSLESLRRHFKGEIGPIAGGEGLHNLVVSALAPFRSLRLPGKSQQTLEIDDSTIVLWDHRENVQWPAPLFRAVVEISLVSRLAQSGLTAVNALSRQLSLEAWRTDPVGSFRSTRGKLETTDLPEPGYLTCLRFLPDTEIFGAIDIELDRLAQLIVDAYGVDSSVRVVGVGNANPRPSRPSMRITPWSDDHPERCAFCMRQGQPIEVLIIARDAAICRRCVDRIGTFVASHLTERQRMALANPPESVLLALIEVGERGLTGRDAWLRYYTDVLGWDLEYAADDHSIWWFGVEDVAEAYEDFIADEIASSATELLMIRNNQWFEARDVGDNRLMLSGKV